MNVLEFDSLYLEFGMINVLSNIYIKCEEGKITALLGRNGSGKSCLMKIVFGSMNAEHKSIRINGIPLMGNYLNKELISYLPQGHFLPSFMTIRNAFNFFRIETYIIENSFPEFVELSKKRIGELSVGQRRMLEVLLVLYSPHLFCILDEPFSRMAPLQIEKLQGAFHTVKKNKGILVTDHLHVQVRSIADVVYVLRDGQTYLIKDDKQLADLGYLNSNQ